MADVVELIEQLEKQNHFDPYFADIIAMRDGVDPPIRRHRRDNNGLILGINDDENGATSIVSLEHRGLVLAFGEEGLLEIAQALVEHADVAEGDTDDELAFDALRFALMVQSGQVFINNRLKIDEDFVKRFTAFLGNGDRRSKVPYQREAMRFPEEIEKPQKDPATQYRVARFASRLAINRLVTFPHSEAIQRSGDAAGMLIIKAMDKAAKEEFDDVVSSAGAPVKETLGKLMQGILEIGDSHPLLLPALAKPIKPGLVSKIAMSHVGERSNPRPGWVSIDSVI